MMKKTNVLSLFLALAATACSDGSSDSVTDKFKSEFRKGFVEGATEQCVAKVPKTSLLSEETVLQVCTCTAEKMADRISVEDMSAILSGNISENVKEQIKQSTTDCLKELSVWTASAPLRTANKPPLLQTSSEPSSDVFQNHSRNRV